MSRIMEKLAVCLTAILVAIGCAVAGQHAAADTIAIQDWSGAMGTTSYAAVNLGYEFVANGAITITKLGVFDYQANGLTDPHPVGIWEVGDPTSTPAGPALATVTVLSGFGSPLEGTLISSSGFRYEELSIPLQLTAGTSYRIAAYYPTNSDAIMQSTAGAYTPPRKVDTTLASAITYNFGHAGRYLYDYQNLSGSGLAYPANTGAREFSYIGPNFQFVPEPGTLALLLSGGLVALVVFVQRRRSR